MSSQTIHFILRTDPNNGLKADKNKDKDMVCEDMGGGGDLDQATAADTIRSHKSLKGFNLNRQTELTLTTLKGLNMRNCSAGN